MYRFYRLLTYALSPLLPFYLNRRARDGKEDLERMGERLGRAGIERPEGKLIWLHGASIGEVLSLLILIDKIKELFPNTSILVTSGTVTSAKLMAEKLPTGVFHQYIPVDTPRAVKKFMEHWQPDMVLWAESELWPNLLMEIQKNKVPSVIINGRMSEKSFANWKKLGSFAKKILNSFQICLVQNSNEAERFRALGGQNVISIGNLKYASEPLTCCEEDLNIMLEALKERPVCLFASTHTGEEELAVRIHKRLKHTLPTSIVIIAPRHPERADEIVEICKREGLKYGLRSSGDIPKEDDDIYIADSLGELGLFFRVVPIVIIGGSFIPHGGHNPIEPARLECQILYGPHMHNFKTICDDFLDASAGRMIEDEDALFEEIHHLYLNPVEGQMLSDNARKLTEKKAHVIDDIMQELYPVFDRAKLLSFSLSNSEMVITK